MNSEGVYASDAGGGLGHRVDVPVVVGVWHILSDVDVGESVSYGRALSLGIATGDG